MADGTMKALPKPGPTWTPTPDLKPDEARWAIPGYTGPACIDADGSWWRPWKWIGWVRGPAWSIRRR